MLWQGLASMLRWTGGTSPSATDALVGSSRDGVRVRPNIYESTYSIPLHDEFAECCMYSITSYGSDWYAV